MRAKPLLERPFVFERLAGMEIRMPEVAHRRTGYLLGDPFAFEDAGEELVARGVVVIGMLGGVVAEFGTRILPLPEDRGELGIAELLAALAFIHEAAEGNTGFPQWPQEALGEAEQIAGASIDGVAAAGQVIDRDCHLAVRGELWQGDEEKKDEAHPLTLS